MGSKVGCFAGFCHHPVTTTSGHMHAYVALSFVRKSNKNRYVNNHFMHKTNMYVSTKDNSNVDFSYNNN